MVNRRQATSLRAQQIGRSTSCRPCHIGRRRVRLPHLWHHGIPALGVPGATNWREDRDAKYLDGIETIYVVIEPDHGGEAVKSWVASSSIRNRVKLVQLSVKDVSALHLRDARAFTKSWHTAMAAAVPWATHEDRAQAET